MTLLEDAKAKQKKLNIKGTLYLSDKPEKKLMLLYENKKIHFGFKGSITYLQGASEEKRKAYRARHKEVLTKNGTRAYKVKYSPSWLSYNILW